MDNIHNTLTTYSIKRCPVEMADRGLIIMMMRNDNIYFKTRKRFLHVFLTYASIHSQSTRPRQSR